MYCPQLRIHPAYIPNKEFLELMDDTGSGMGNVDYSEIADNADGIIDGFLREREDIGDLPLDPVPPLIERIAAYLYIHDLYTRRGMMNGVIETQYRQIMGIGAENQPGLLRQIADGDLSIGIETSASSVTIAVRANKDASDQSLSLRNLDAVFPRIGGGVSIKSR